MCDSWNGLLCPRTLLCVTHHQVLNCEDNLSLVLFAIFGQPYRGCEMQIKLTKMVMWHEYVPVGRGGHVRLTPSSGNLRQNHYDSSYMSFPSYYFKMKVFNTNAAKWALCWFMLIRSIDAIYYVVKQWDWWNIIVSPVVLQTAQWCPSQATQPPHAVPWFLFEVDLLGIEGREVGRVMSALLCVLLKRKQCSKRAHVPCTHECVEIYSDFIATYYFHGSPSVNGVLVPPWGASCFRILPQGRKPVKLL